MDFRWGGGLITDKDEYLEKRVQLQQELERLISIPEDELAKAADLLQDFLAHWDAANDDRKAQKLLLQGLLRGCRSRVNSL